jgi:GNAT superfamily N-acetyltransferase
MVGMIPAESEVELEPIVVTEAWRGLGIGRHLVECVLAKARTAGVRQLVTRPTARNAAAVQFFYSLGFDVLGQLELLLDCRPSAEQRWQPGARIADRDLRV